MSAAASASSTALAIEAAVATGLSAAMSGGLGAAVGGAAGSLASLFGFKDVDLKQVGESLAANHSAVVALVIVDEVNEVSEFLERLGGKVTHGSVSQPMLDLAASHAPSDAAADDAPDAGPTPGDSPRAPAD